MVKHSKLSKDGRLLLRQYDLHHQKKNELFAYGEKEKGEEEIDGWNNLQMWFHYDCDYGRGFAYSLGPKWSSTCQGPPRAVKGGCQRGEVQNLLQCTRISRSCRAVTQEKLEHDF
jgi:hypothetical protein